MSAIPVRVSAIQRERRDSLEVSWIWHSGASAGHDRMIPLGSAGGRCVTRRARRSSRVRDTFLTAYVHL